MISCVSFSHSIVADYVQDKRSQRQKKRTNILQFERHTEQKEPEYGRLLVSAGCQCLWEIFHSKAIIHVCMEETQKVNFIKKKDPTS